MKKILMLRYNKTAMIGGNIKWKDYFLHCRRHPRLEVGLRFTPESARSANPLWADLPDSVPLDGGVDGYDLLFITGKEWNHLPPDLGGKPVINLIQGARHGDADDPRFPFLRRRALRICVSEEVRDAVLPHAVGRTVVIKNGIPLDLFGAPAAKRPGSVLVWAKKNPGLGKRLKERLSRSRADVRLLTDPLPREDFARALGESDIFVSLPERKEGFYLPALEGMAACCAVVCADAVGNREFCLDGETCLVPAFDDLESHAAAVDRLLADAGLKEKLRHRGHETAQAYSLEAERDAFYRVLEEEGLC